LERANVAEHETDKIREILRFHGVPLAENPDHIFCKDLADWIFFELFVVVDMFNDIPDQERLAWKRIYRHFERLEKELADLDGSKVQALRGGLIDEIVSLSVRFREELTALYKRDPVKPKTAHGEVTIAVFQLLRDSGVRDAWKCSKIIADLLVATGKEQNDKTEAIYNRLSQLR
jgi:hypothetical protein